MVCKICKATIPDDSLFCPSCGKKVEAEPAAAPAFSSAFRRAGSLDGSDLGMGSPAVERQPVTPQEDTGLRFSSSLKRTDSVNAEEPAAARATPRWDNSGDSSSSFGEEKVAANLCPHCGGPLDPGAKFCNNCGKKLGESLAKKVEKRLAGIKMLNIPKKGVIAAVSVVAVLAIILIVGFATNWFGAGGPAAQIGSAVKNTLTAKNFSVDFTYTDNRYNSNFHEASGTAYVSIDPKNRDITVYADLNANGKHIVIAVYEGYYIKRTANGCIGDDIGDQLDDFFDAFEEGVVNYFNLEEYIDRMSKEDVDFDVLETCRSSYVENLNDKKWLEENAGYSVEKDGGVTMHRFTPDYYDFLKASVKCFEKAFINQDLYYETIDSIAEAQSRFPYYSDMIVFGVKDGRLVHFEGERSGSNGLLDSFFLDPDDTETHIEIEADFYDFGKTEFDTDELEYMLAEVKQNW